jgi:hypothetical protein
MNNRVPSLGLIPKVYHEVMHAHDLQHCRQKVTRVPWMPAMRCLRQRLPRRTALCTACENEMISATETTPRSVAAQAAEADQPPCRRGTLSPLESTKQVEHMGRTGNIRDPFYKISMVGKLSLVAVSQPRFIVVFRQHLFEAQAESALSTNARAMLRGQTTSSCVQHPRTSRSGLVYTSIGMSIKICRGMCYFTGTVPV